MDTIAIQAELANITKSATAIAATIVDKTPLDRMKADFQNYFRNTVQGTVLNWCGGTLTKNADGSASYLLPSGDGIKFTATTDLALLYVFPEIKASWDKNYPGSAGLMSIEAIRLSVKNVTTLLTPEVIPPPSTTKLVWQTTKAAAIASAKARGKRVLLLGGRESCSVTTGMRDQACESLTPPLKALIEHYFIPWYGNSEKNTEYYSYVNGIGTFNLPVIGVIDPNNSAACLARSFGNQDFTVLYNWMLKYAPKV